MQQSKSKLRSYLSVFKPTTLGWVYYVFLAALGITLNQFEMIKKYLDIPHSWEPTRIIAAWADTLLTKTVGQSATESLVVGLFWAAVGLVVYVFLRIMARVFAEFDDNLGVRKFVWPKDANRDKPLRRLGEQVLIRCVAFGGLILTIFGPLAAVLRGPNFLHLAGSSELLQIALWFFVSVAVWHLVVIWIRLIMLKARLLG